MAQSAIRGRIVTMDAAGTVLADGVAYIADTAIAAVLPADHAPPAGFEHVPRVRAGGTVYPGLIELHNHLSYNCLQLWQVPRPFANRGQWSTGPDYRRLISGPMQVIGKTPDLVAPLVRYVEAKCLVAGVTTSQGIALYSDAGIRRFYKGVVRNVEEPDDPALPAAASRIPDVAAADVTRFAAELERDHRLLLHLAEGTDDPARRHFLDLQLPDGSWALSDHLIGIHSVGLHAEDIPVLAAHGAGMVWSPLSNLLLYGATARVAEMKAAGVPIGLGSDWSPSGSKNLLGELKVARLYSANAAQGPIFTDQELVAMVTTTAAKMLGWDGAIGSLEAGKRADLIAVGGATADPYAGLIAATERDLVLVMIGGVACAGQPHLVAPYTQNGEPVTIGGRTRVLNFDPAGADPDVALDQPRGRAVTAAGCARQPARACPRARAAGRCGRPRRRRARAARARPDACPGRDRAHPHEPAHRPAGRRRGAPERADAGGPATALDGARPARARRFDGRRRPGVHDHAPGRAEPARLPGAGACRRLRAGAGAALRQG